jgi:hypothetical protein
MINYDEKEVEQRAQEYTVGFSIFTKHYMSLSVPDYSIDGGHVGYSTAEVFKSLYESDENLAAQLFGALLLYYVHKSGFDGLPPLNVKEVSE